MAEFELLQPLWLVLVPLILLWLSFKTNNPSKLPTFVSAISIRFPPLVQLSTLNKVKKKAYINGDKQIAFIFLLFTLALAQPVSYQGSINQQSKNEPVEMILMVNTSVSMVIKDYLVDGKNIDRLTLAKQLLNDFIAEYSGSRIALVMHANPPMLWLPLTTDKQTVQHAVSRIDPAIGGRLSDLGASLSLVSQTFTEGENKVVLLIADGSLQIGKKSPIEVSKQLAEQGFFVYVIAMGTSNLDNAKSNNTDLLYEPVNLNALQQIAENGKGQLFHAIDKKSFQNALNIIESKHRKQIVIDVDNRLIKVWYPAFILLGMFLLILILLPISTKGRHV